MTRLKMMQQQVQQLHQQGQQQFPSKIQQIWKSCHSNDGFSKYDGRDIMGSGQKQPCPKWPNGARVAINFCIHFEEGAEYCELHGDGDENNNLNREQEKIDNNDLESNPISRNLVVESLYEYGARVGFWRLHRIFKTRKIPCTVFAAGMVRNRIVKRRSEIVPIIKFG
jgi:hypothetical protein